MVKAKKGLLFSLFALVVALVVTTTSTYAWFAMNSVVEATNMQITVKSDNTYLVISNTAPEGGKFAGTAEDTIATTTNSASVFPTRVKSTSTTSANLTWETAFGTGYDNGTAKAGTVADIAVEDQNKYVLKSTFYVGLNPNVSVANASNLRVKELTLTTVSGDSSKVFFDALSVAVVTSTYVDNYVSAGHNANATTGVVAGSTQALASEINKDGTAIQVDVYVYIDGDNSNVKTSNATAANLGSYKVDVAFEVTPGHAS